MQVMERFLLPAVRCTAVVLGLLVGGRVALALAAPAPGKILISDVIISGNQRMSVEQVKARLRTKVGDEFNQAVVDEDVRELYKTGQFSNIYTWLQPDGNEHAKIFFSVREMPNMVQKVTYKGAKHIPEKDLPNITGVRSGSPLNPLQNRQGCQKIMEKYFEQGRWLADCQLTKGGDLADTEVIYQITEGPKVKVRGIQFIGDFTKFVSGARLRTQVNSSQEWFHLIGGTYNKQMADADVGKLYEYFHNFGYQDAHISLETQRTADSSGIILVFHIQLGPRYKLQDMPDVHGSREIPREQLIALSSFKPGEYLDQGKIKRDTKVITDYMGASGIDARVEAVPVWVSDTPGVCNVRYEVVERQPSRVGQVFIVGNERTRDNVILRQVPLFPGQILTFPDLDIASNNLKRLGIFTSGQDGPAPEVSVLDREGDAEFKDVQIKVNEANTGSLIFGVGVNSNTGLVGSIVLNERNFDIFNPPTSLQDFLNSRAWRGAGQNFRVTAMPGTIMQMYDVSFIEPFLFDTRNSLHEDAYFRMMFFNEYEEQRLGNRITLGRQLNRFWNVALGTRVENVNVGNLPSGDPVDYQSVQGNNLQIGVPITVTRDSRDSLIRPTQGSQLQMSYEELQGLAGFQGTFGVFNMLVNKFFTTYQRSDGSGRQVLVYRGQFGLASDNTPVYERFFAGGFTTIRGFQWRGVGPNTNGFFTGGDMLLLNSLEYQVPVTANDQIFVVGFVDSGTVSPRITDFENYAVSVGFGVRFTVPMLGPVPIALDFGFPVVKPPGDVTQVFNFWMGFSR
jgi:outer membrane protein insertion porin family